MLIGASGSSALGVCGSTGVRTSARGPAHRLRGDWGAIVRQPLTGYPRGSAGQHHGGAMLAIAVGCSRAVRTLARAIDAVVAARRRLAQHVRRAIIAKHHATALGDAERFIKAGVAD